MTTPDITLPQHEAASESRAAHLGDKIDTLKEHDMAQPVNVFTTPASGGDASHSALPIAAMAMMGQRHQGMDGYGMHGVGAGLGAGLVGGLLGGILFGGNGFNNRRDGVDGAAAELATARVAFDTVALQSLNGISAAIPAAAGGVKDAVLAAIQGLSSDTAAGFATQGTNTLQQTILLVQQANAVQAALTAAINTTNMNVSDQGSATRATVVDDGEKTRALLVARFQLEDATRINELNAQVLALQNQGTQRDLGTRIDIQNTAIAAQAQGQQQQQQQQLVATVNSLFPLLQGVLQVAHATNSNVIAGNTGAVVTGPQTANPTNVNA